MGSLEAIRVFRRLECGEKDWKQRVAPMNGSNRGRGVALGQAREER
jgi:hypothetical protein